MTVSLYKWTIQDWHTLVKSGVLAEKKVELLAGDIVQMSPEGFKHSGTNSSVADYLRDLLKGKAYIREGHPITLDESCQGGIIRASEPEPDIAIVKLPREIYLQGHPVAKDIYWLIEVSDRTLAKDLGSKANIYAQNGIPEYWIIDLRNNKVIVHLQPSSGKYQSIKEYRSGEFQPLAFPELNVQLNQLLLY